MIQVYLEALDGNPITQRTGKSLVRAEMSSLPIEGSVHLFFYVNEKCESPGVQIATDDLERVDNEYSFVDDKKRPFKVTIISFDADTLK